MRILILCVATFAAGLLAGSILRPDEAATRHRSPGPRATPRPPGTGFDVDRPGTAEPGGEADREIEAVGDLAAEAEAEIERLFGSERARPLLTGEGTIAGTARDSGGAAVEGVVVTALPEAQPFDLALAGRRLRERPHDDRVLAEAAREAMEAELWRRRARHVATTGPDGRFELNGLMDARYSLTAFHDRYDVQPASKQRRIVPDAVFDFVARPVRAVRVEVRMPDGAVAEHAWLSWKGPHGDGSGPWTKEGGTARLPAGECAVRAQTWTPEPLQSEEVECPGEDAAPDEPLVLQLAGRRLLTVRLVPAPGIVMPRWVEYRLVPVGPGVEADPVALLKKGGDQRRATASAPGRALWYDLDPGRYLVAALLGGRRLLAHAVADVGEGRTELELAMAAPAGEHLLVRVVGPEGGLPPGQLGLHVVLGSDAAPRYERTQALQREDGTWMVMLDGIDAKGARAAKLRVSTLEYGAVLREFRFGDRGPITIRFGKPALLKVEVEGYPGRRGKARVYLGLRGPRGMVAYGEVADDGGCKLSGVQPGDYGLVLVVNRGKDLWSIHQERVGLKAGEEARSIAVPKLHVLRVRLPDGMRAGKVVLHCADPSVGAFRREAVVSAGVATFDGIAAGAYEVEYGPKRAALRVPGPDEVLLD